jgi:hypothetical protein
MCDKENLVLYHEFLTWIHLSFSQSFVDPFALMVIVNYREQRMLLIFKNTSL